MKSYTSLEQSKKLSEILLLESADACWTNHMFGSLLSSWRIESTPPQEYKYLLDRFAVRGYLIEPAWSLSALLDVLPRETRLLKSATDDIFYHTDCPKGNVDEWFDNPVDACYEMIIKLNKLKLL